LGRSSSQREHSPNYSRAAEDDFVADPMKSSVQYGFSDRGIYGIT
jgi:hypothetical protein